VFKLSGAHQSSSNSSVGNKGKLSVSIKRPDGSRIIDSIAFEILAESKDKGKKSQLRIPKFDIRGIAPTDPEWSMVWSDIDEDASQDLVTSVAFKPIEAQGSLIVYYSKVFAHFTRQYDEMKERHPDLVQEFEKDYRVWICYHGILDHLRERSHDAELTEEQSERMREENRKRIATVQVKQSISTARLRLELVNKTQRDD
jgi:hypothetical protein